MNKKEHSLCVATSSHPTTTRGDQPKDDRTETWREPGSLMVLLVTGAANSEDHPTTELPFM